MLVAGENSNSAIALSSSARAASSRARIHRSSTSRGRSSGFASPALARIRRATFQSLFASFAPSSIGPGEKRTSCVEAIFKRP